MKINILHNTAMKQHSEWSYCQGTLIFSVPIPLWQLDGKREHDLRRQRTKKWACAKWPAGSWWLARMSTTTHPTGRNRNMATKSWAPDSSWILEFWDASLLQTQVYSAVNSAFQQPALFIFPGSLQLLLHSQEKILAIHLGIWHSSTFSDHARVVNS